MSLPTPYYDDGKGIVLYHGDARTILSLLEPGSVDCVVTSPPYWGLRDYGVDGQLGLERTPEEYVARMVEVFREVRRVLRDDGTCWLNLGDSYNGSGPSGGDGKQYSNVGSQSTTVKRVVGLKPKDLCGIPWRVAFALQAPDYLGRIRRESDRAWLAALVDGEGCITILEATSPHGSGSSYPPVLQVRMCDTQCIEKAAQITGCGLQSPKQEPPSQRNQRGSYQWRLNGRKAADIIAEIYPFLLIKRKQAIVAWNHQSIRDGYTTKRGVKIPADDLAKQLICRKLVQQLNRREAVDIPSWMIEPPIPVGQGWYLRQDLIWAKPNPMPESVTDRCTKAHEYIFLLSKGERYWYDQEAVRLPPSGERGGAVFGGYRKGTALREQGVRVHGRECTKEDRDRYANSGANLRSVWTITPQPFPQAHFATFPEELPKLCILAGCKPGGVVLEPFSGAGTTLKAARELGHKAVGIELNSDYCSIAVNRLAQGVLGFS